MYSEGIPGDTGVAQQFGGSSTSINISYYTISTGFLYALPSAKTINVLCIPY